MKLQRYSSVVAVMLVSVVAVWLLMTAMPVQGGRQAAPPPAPADSIAQAFAPEDSLLPGEPCGAGERLPPWAICLYGTVSQTQPSGQVIALDGVPITVTFNTRTITCGQNAQSVAGTTFVHPGQVAPSFGIDISPLEPEFLEPVTVSVKISGEIIQRQVVVYPDFKTQNQRFDIQVPEEPRDPIWGYVVDFDAGGPVAGATVTAEHDGLLTTTTTALQDSEPLPLYTLTAAQLNDIGVGPDDTVTLTAYYHGDTDRKVITRTTERQVNFVTNWWCDGFNPLPPLGGGPGIPQTGGGQGMPSDGCVPGLPQTGGGQGMPPDSPDMTDMVCFWGYGLVDGEPVDNMLVRLEIGGTVYETKTGYYPGEKEPRYRIGLWGRHTISRELMAATGVYNGYVDSQEIMLALVNDLSQNVDFSINTTDTLSQSDLALRMEGPRTALTNGGIVYTLHLTNQGILAADDPILSLALTPALDYSGTGIPSEGTSLITWKKLDSLPPGASIAPQVVTFSLPSDVQPRDVVTAVARVTSITTETFVANNTAQVATIVQDSRPDVRVSMIGPPRLVPNSSAVYDIWVDNVGWQDAQTTTLKVVLPPGLKCQAAYTEPFSSDSNSLVWNLGTLLARSEKPEHIALTLTVASTVPVGPDLGVSAFISTAATPDRDPLNNTILVTIPTSLDNAYTLILVAPDRLAERYGASPLLSEIYRLAEHHRVRAILLDVRRDPWTTSYLPVVFKGGDTATHYIKPAYAPSSPQDQSAAHCNPLDVVAAYAAWDLDPGNSHKANCVAAAIKSLIDYYASSYPKLRYVLFVGGDNIIPFYRVADQNPTSWREITYQNYVPSGTVRSALADDLFLTDDFYTDLTPRSSSPFSDGHPLYLPDVASGRLVETPEEIMTAISTFLTLDGAISLAPAVVSADERLTADLGKEQRRALKSAGIALECAADGDNFRQQFLDCPSGSAWPNLHSNHFSIGPLYLTDVLSDEERVRVYSQTVLSTIGCHAGLNVPQPDADSKLPDLDLAQALLERGGSYIASTSYAYASQEGLGYSEELAQELTCQLLEVQTQTLGLALMRAKQVYYASHSGLDYIDEKALLPMTLYGLPMLQVSAPSAGPCPRGDIPSLETRLDEHTTVVTHTLNGLTYTLHTTDAGDYYDYAGQIIAQHGLPVQPMYRAPLTATLNGQTLRGVLLHTVTYTEHENFDPLIAQSWAMGARRPLTQAEPPLEFIGWDRKYFNELGIFEGLQPTDTVASLNFVLGAYNSQTRAERLVKRITLEAYYSDSSDKTPPTIESSEAYTSSGQTFFEVRASDNQTVTQVLVTYDADQDHWPNVNLELNAGKWKGEADVVAKRYFVQVIDDSRNVTVGSWQEPDPLPPPQLTAYLPLILR